MSPRLKLALFSTTFLLVGLGAGYFLGKGNADDNVNQGVSNDKANQQKLDEQRAGGYKFINPLLDCSNYQPSALTTVVEMETAVKDYIQSAIDGQKASFISMYFRDLNNGPWIGVNEREDYSPASLLKLPIMIAAFKKAEIDSHYLRQKLLYKERLDKTVEPNIKDSSRIKIGQSYMVEQLVERMIINSDNEAKELLLRSLDVNFILRVMQEIGVNTKGVDMGKDFITVKDYSSFFRLLYNATYLNREMSERALEILSKTKFENGIVAGVPKGTVVAHKFGERAFSDTNIKQLHDCGIVYAGDNVYVVCIMTRGTDFNSLTSVISDLSSLIYKRVTSTNTRQ